eukprot:1154444-Rhodomonas_salina.1
MDGWAVCYRSPSVASMTRVELLVLRAIGGGQKRDGCVTRERESSTGRAVVHGGLLWRRRGGREREAKRKGASSREERGGKGERGSQRGGGGRTLKGEGELKREGHVGERGCERARKERERERERERESQRE